MLLARILEEKLASLYRAGGRIVGGVYLGKGQEAFSAAMGVQLQKGRDIFGALIRDQAGRLAFGEPLLDSFRTYLGAVTGPMRGRDGNVHRGRPKEGLPAMISHLGSLVSVVNGMLFARRLQGRLGDAVGATSIGEGGTSTGSFHEALNQAAVERLPLVVAVANNQFAYSTANERQFHCEDLVERARGYGIEGCSIDGTDLVACVQAFSKAVRRAREGHGPQMVVGTLLRLSGHGEHDDASYIPEEKKKSSLGRDCISVAEQRLVAEGWMTTDEVKDWRAQCGAEVETALAQASKEPVPDPFRESWRALSTSELVEGQHEP
ncbi:MAG: thiamine pyrophosphate-dependent dehydrogenase E1 component subunit alpha [Verrucomicrobiaceae bacterium]|nr:thiamine pyrophosphate-dependent dehydrogenase E1 component subunit alpha [Verrucomicrobiaceae bacterium]